MLMFALTVLLAAPALWFASTYNLHMLQLNTYINKEHYSWLNDNLKKQWLLLAIAVVGVIQMFIISNVIVVIEWLLFVLAFFIFKLTCEMNSKKPLHFTARAKRILATDFVVTYVLLSLTCLFWGNRVAAGAMAVLLGLQIVMVPLANTINAPIEKAVRQRYINEAKAILNNCENLTVIGVTGSYGKTSMKFYLTELLSTKYNVLMTPESYNTPMGIVKTIRESLTPSTDIFVCEMGARYVGEIKEICDIVHPHHGIITSIGPAHLMTFGSLENIAKTKFELADALPEGGKLFVNADSDLVLNQLDVREGQDVHDNVILYSANVDADADVVSDIEEVTCNGTDFVTYADDDFEEEFHTRLVGAHNVINLTGAIAVARSFDVSAKEIAANLRKIRPVPHRMELRKTGDVTIIDDAFNSNPVGSAAAVETLSMFDGVRILVTPGMVELGDGEDQYNFEFGEKAAECVDWIVLVGKVHTQPIKNGALRAGFPRENIEAFDTFNEAIAFAQKIDRENGEAFILLENDLPDNYS